MDWARIGSCYVGCIFIGSYASIFSNDKNNSWEKFDFVYCIPFIVVVDVPFSLRAKKRIYEKRVTVSFQHECLKSETIFQLLYT